jgi:hypothetical protein
MNMRHYITYLLPALGFLGQLFAGVAGAAEPFALIDEAQEPYVLTEAQYDTGFRQQAIRVTGTAGYASIPFTANLPQTASFTVEAFVKMDSPGTGSGIVAVRRGASSQDWQLWCSKKGEVAFQAFSSSTSNAGSVVSVQHLELGKWYHIAVSVDANLQASIYINGELDNKVILKESVNTSASSAIPIFVAGSGIEGRVFPGLVDDFRFSSGVISPNRLAEVKTLLAAKQQ